MSYIAALVLLTSNYNNLFFLGEILNSKNLQWDFLFFYLCQVVTASPNTLPA